MTKCFVVLVTAFVASACYTSAVNRSLSSIESYLQAHPDSALIQIQAINPAVLRTSCERAKYSLLYSIALDKNYIDTTDVSIIKPAVDYYCRHSGSKEKAQAYYYQGRIYENGQDYPSAAISFLSALDAGKECDDPKIKEMICSAIARIHNQNYNNADELKFSLLAYDYAMMQDDSIHQALARMNLAKAYHNNRNFDKADSLYALVCSGSKPLARAFTLRGDNEMKRVDRNPEKAVGYFEKALALQARFNDENRAEYACALILSGRSEEGELIIRHLESSSKANTDYWRYIIYKAQGKFELALDALEGVKQNSDDVVRRQLEQSIYKLESSFYEMNAKMARQERDSAKLTLWLGISLMAIILLSMAILLLTLRKRNLARIDLMDIRYNETLDMLHAAENQADENERRLAGLRTSFARMYQNQFKRIGYCFEKPGRQPDDYSSIISRQMSDEISTILKEISTRDAKNKEFERRIDEDLDGIMSKLRTDYPSLMDSDYQILGYYIVGFDATTISYLMNMDSHHIRTRKSRLKEKINKEPTANIDLYKTFIR